MSGSGRKRRSLWDCKDETLLPAQISENNTWHGKESYSSLSANRDPKWSDMEAGNALKSKDCSEPPSWEPSQRNRGQKDDNRGLNDIPETRRAWDGDKSYEVSMGFDEWEQRNHSRSPENSWRQSRRYARSRSRGRSRSRSRSWSRGRSRSQSRGRDQSRDRDRGFGKGRGRSPLADHGQESYGWSEKRRGGWGLPSQACRDFSAGKCRRGSQCRFLHQDNLRDRDGGRLERDRAERWSSRWERGGSFYDGEKDEPTGSNNRSTMLCNDFLKGRCHRGSSCRYLHHDASGDETERSNRNLSLDQDYKRQMHKTVNIPCKFFMMGKCNRDSCRFSHDGPELGNLERKSQDDRWGHDIDEVNKSWNGPKWGEETAVADIAHATGFANVEKMAFIDPTTAEKQNDDKLGHSFNDMNKQWSGTKCGNATGASEIPKSTGWGNSDVENLKLTDPVNTEKRAGGKLDHSLNNDIRIWGPQVWKDKAAEGDENASPHWGSGSHVVSMGITGSKAVAKAFDREEPLLTPRSLPAQTPDGIFKSIHEQNTVQDGSGQQLLASVEHSVFPENSLIVQQHSKMVDNNAKTVYSNSVNGLDIYGNAGLCDPGQNLNQCADSFGPQPPNFGGNIKGEYTISVSPSNERGIDLNGPVQLDLSPADLQNRGQDQQGESAKTLVNSSMPEIIFSSVQGAQVTDLPATLTQLFANGQLPQLYAALNNSKELVPSLPNSVSVRPPISSMDTQPDPVSMSQKEYDTTGDSIESKNPGNCIQPPGFLSNFVEQKNQMLLERSSPSSAAGFDSGKLCKNGRPEDDYNGGPELSEQKPVANSVLEEGSKLIADKCKQEPENIPAEDAAADVRVGDGTNGKDEKAMRLFKISLVEFVKEILKPKWKEGQMSREVHKTIVKKVVDKVTSTIQAVNMPKTQDKIDQYLSYSKPKLTKLVEAYSVRFLKAS